MKFFKQLKENTCHIIAIQHTLSFFEKYPCAEEITKALPKHSFGNSIFEIGIYLENKGFKTKLISNYHNLKNDNNKFDKKSFQRYKKIGKFEDRLIKEKDIKEKPIIVNVDYFKIRNISQDPSPHYVVILKEKDTLFLFDGDNYSRRVRISFDKIYECSIYINRFHEKGMWLILE